jgi:hypothetical protein
MAACVIWHPGDRDYYCGPEIGWSKQLRLAAVFPTGKAAKEQVDAFPDWMRPALQVISVWWRVRSATGGHVCERSTQSECQSLIAEYAGRGGWMSGPYRIFRVIRRRVTAKALDKG